MVNWWFGLVAWDWNRATPFIRGSFRKTNHQVPKLPDLRFTAHVEFKIMIIILKIMIIVCTTTNNNHNHNNHNNNKWHVIINPKSTPPAMTVSVILFLRSGGVLTLHPSYCCWGKRTFQKKSALKIYENKTTKHIHFKILKKNVQTCAGGLSAPCIGRWENRTFNRKSWKWVYKTLQHKVHDHPLLQPTDVSSDAHMRNEKGPLVV